MKSLFKKYFFILAIMCIAVTCIATFGYADFVFNTSDISNGIGSSNNSITQTADPIRQNAVFGEAGDASASGTQYYDVYFMAQAKKISTVNDLQNPYYEAFDNGQNEANYGAFYDSDGNLLTNNLSINENRYFYKFENVAEVSVSMLDLVGEPTINLTDTTDGAYPLSFMNWTVECYNVYSSDWYNTEYKTGKVYGIYPESNSELEIFYNNTLLSLYDNKSIVINGKKCIFIYPYYTVGKNYGGSNRVEELRLEKRAAGIDITNNDGSSEYQFFSFDGSFNTLSNVELFRIDNVVFDATKLNSESFYLNSDPNKSGGWGGSRIWPTYMASSTYLINVNGKNVSINESASGNTNNFSNNLLKINSNSGRYNIYLFVKINNNNRTSTNFDSKQEAINNISSEMVNSYFSTDDIENISNYLKEQNIISYKTEISDIMAPNFSIAEDGWFWNQEFYISFSYTRQYYLVYERIYEPRLIGGTTGSFFYNENADYTFTRVGISGETKNHYVLNSVLLDPKNFTEFEYNEESIKRFNNYFAVQLLPEDGMNYNEVLLDEPPGLSEDNIPAGYDWPTLIVSDQEGDDYKPYFTKSLLGGGYSTNVDESKKLVHTLDENNSGLFNIYIKVIYSDNELGGKSPSAIEIYAYQFNNMYINVYDDETSVLYHKEDDNNLSNLDETGYLVSSACEWRMVNLKQGAKITKETEMIQYKQNSVTGVWAPVKIDNTDENVTKLFSEYLTELDNENDCLKELVTGKYITLENYESFVIDKNYAFVRCDNPYASNQGGVTA